MSFILSIALFLGSETPSQSNNNQPVDCAYDLDAMLKLDYLEFDQDLNGGWRPLAAIEGCELAAAELIREWRFHKRSHNHVLYWHEGQTRARAGQTKQAIALFDRSRISPEYDTIGWNYYVEGTIAFLNNNRQGLEKSIVDLQNIPPSSESQEIIMADGRVIKFEWPPNLKVLKSFQKCWGKSYSEAYGGCKNLYND